MSLTLAEARARAAAVSDVSYDLDLDLTDPAQVVGKKLTRQLNANQVIAPSHLEAAEVIRRGDQVVINAVGANFSVRMPGEALTDGAPGEQINIRNLRSQRVIRARVVGPGQVEVAM